MSYTAKEMPDEDDQHPLCLSCVRVKTFERMRFARAIQHGQVGDSLQIPFGGQFVGHLNISFELAGDAFRVGGSPGDHIDSIKVPPQPMHSGRNVVVGRSRERLADPLGAQESNKD